MRLIFSILLMLSPLLKAELAWESLIKAMSSNAFSERKEASETIIAWAKKNPPEALAEIPLQMISTEDPEARMRLEAILREIYIPETRALFGFQYEPYRTPSIFGNTQTTLLIQLVMGETAAARGEMQRHDRITAINGKPINPKFDDDELRNFFSKVPTDKPTTFGIIRAEKEMKLRITPDSHELSAEEKKVFIERFDRWLEKTLDDLKADVQ
ncbi:hypothetical protein N9192_01010 [Akkermansiaceae bacterium]|nr:hypothetical protein [Akkermansiaceae bacterium]MDB4408685.1 hypothetical protein [Akkermansiaceae bacterium]MDB4436110.1 hypothetical protein [Akkermansiaceae bacterium]MDB4541453.1 hypothetical protein [Akkermansiaceae bacterium]